MCSNAPIPLAPPLYISSPFYIYCIYTFLLPALHSISKAIESEEFTTFRATFVSSNLSHFTYGDDSTENKLEYTQIHGDYETKVESLIVKNLPCKLEDLMEALPDYMEEKMDQTDNASGEAIKMLLEVSDFQQFRSMMMYEKQRVEEAVAAEANTAATSSSSSSSDSKGGVAFTTGGGDLNVTGTGDSVHEMMGLVSALSDASGEVEGWQNCLTLDWMKIDMMAVPVEKRKKKNDIYLRGVWTMNLSFDECCDMMFTFSPRRKTWDSNFSSVSFPYGGSFDDDEVVASTAITMGYLVNLVMFQDKNGTQLTTRNFRTWEKSGGSSGGGDSGGRKVTYAMVPWSLKSDSIDDKHPFLTLKTGTINTHPTDPSKCIMTTLEINGMGGMPKWGLNFMLKATAPGLMKGMEVKYRKAAKKEEGERGVGAASTEFRFGSRRAAEEKEEVEEGKDSRK